MTQKKEILGRYEILEALTSGGMAEVYLARVAGEKASSKIFALKKVRSDLSNDDDFRKMFEREIGLATALNHPNIIRTLDFGNCEDVYFMTMEYIRGQPLQALAAKLANLDTLPEIGFPCFTVSRVCRALSYAHTYCDPVTKNHAGIVHCDISPQNVLVGYDGHVKLFDFGVASLGGKDALNSGQTRGKPSYLSPEQALGKRPDDRSDIFSIGIVLWELLTASRLFYDEEPMNAVRRVLHQEIPPPSAINPKIPKSLDLITLKALTRNHRERYQLASELALELDRVLLNEGIVFGEKQSRELMANFFGELALKKPVPVADAGQLPEDGDTESNGLGGLFTKLAIGGALLAAILWGAFMFFKPPAPGSDAWLATHPPDFSTLDPGAAADPIAQLKYYTLLFVSIGDGDGATTTVNVDSGSNAWPTALILSSIGAVRWQVKVKNGVNLARIYLSTQTPGSTVSVASQTAPVVVPMNLPLLPFNEEFREAVLGRAPANAIWKPGTQTEVMNFLGSQICLLSALRGREFFTAQCREGNQAFSN